MKRPDIIDQILELLRRPKYRTRNTDAGPVQQQVGWAAPRGATRRSLARRLRRGKERWAAAQDREHMPPGSPIARRTEESYRRALRWLEAGEHVTPARKDQLARMPLAQRASRMLRWLVLDRAHAAALKSGTTTKRRLARTTEARALLAKGLTQAAIATKMKVSERQVRRWLAGK